MRLNRFFPKIALQSFVKEYLIIESDTELHNKIIPDSSIVMAFRCMGNVSATDGDNTIDIPAAAISGLRKSTRTIHYAKQTATLLVIFQEGGINPFSKIPAQHLFEESISLDNLFPAQELRDILDKLATAKSHPQRIDIIESFLLKKLNNNKPDKLILNAIQLIKKQNGAVRIKTLASALFISQDPFEKRFKAMVGTTPKQFTTIIRLRNLIAKHTSLSSLTKASYNAGYFDQSHFIKDFKLFTGQPPKDFFRSGAFW